MIYFTLGVREDLIKEIIFSLRPNDREGPTVRSSAEEPLAGRRPSAKFQRRRQTWSTTERKRAGSRYAVSNQERDREGSGRLGQCFSAPAALRNQLEAFCIFMGITHTDSDLLGPGWGLNSNKPKAP